jgi:hypothetical protein
MLLASVTNIQPVNSSVRFLYVVYRGHLQVNWTKPTIMRKIHKITFTLTLSLHVSTDMPSSSGDTKCYMYQSINKCKFFLHASNLVYNKNLRNLIIFCWISSTKYLDSPACPRRREAKKLCDREEAVRELRCSLDIIQAAGIWLTPCLFRSRYDSVFKMSGQTKPSSMKEMSRKEVL